MAVDGKNTETHSHTLCEECEILEHSSLNEMCLSNSHPVVQTAKQKAERV